MGSGCECSKMRLIGPTFAGALALRFGYPRKQLRRSRQLAAAFSGTDSAAVDFLIMTHSPFAEFDLERAIALRWTLRDIIAKRLKLTPVGGEDLRTLVDLGYVEVQDGTPVATQAGLDALD